MATVFKGVTVPIPVIIILKSVFLAGSAVTGMAEGTLVAVFFCRPPFPIMTHAA